MNSMSGKTYIKVKVKSVKTIGNIALFSYLCIVI